MTEHHHQGHQDPANGAPDQLDGEVNCVELSIKSDQLERNYVLRYFPPGDDRDPGGEDRPGQSKTYADKVGGFLTRNLRSQDVSCGVQHPGG